MKTLISKKDFVKPYPVLSPNASESQISDCIWRAQDCNLRDAIGTDLHADIMRVYELEKSATNVIIGIQTIITLNNVMDLQIGYFVSFKDFQGTIASSINGLQFEILAISGNDVTIGLNSVGKTWTVGGTLERIFTPKYKELFGYIEPFLIYASYALYVPLGAVQSTASGLMVHQVGEASHMTDKRIGELVNQYIQSANTYLERLCNFLNNNSQNYPFFKSEQNNSLSNPIFFGKKNKYKGTNL